MEVPNHFIDFKDFKDYIFSERIRLGLDTVDSNQLLSKIITILNNKNDLGELDVSWDPVFLDVRNPKVELITEATKDKIRFYSKYAYLTMR